MMCPRVLLKVKVTSLQLVEAKSWVTSTEADSLVERSGKAKENHNENHVFPGGLYIAYVCTP